ncbi:MAG TPA: hypothetical protein DCW90_03800 [Lachnospiraceae bacterium]|nr:hypothetical protein [Lachnospiraceae bacterium]
MRYRGTNPIISTSNDTTTQWCKLGPGYWMYAKSGCLNNQPSTYGFLINLCYNNNPSDVHQIWMSQQSTGSFAYHRCGGSSGWVDKWKLFSPGTATAAQVLSGYTFSSANGSNLSGSMANRGTLKWSSNNTTYTVPAGYYSGGTLDSRPSYNLGYNNGYKSGSTDARPGTWAWATTSGTSKTLSFTTDGGGFFVGCMSGHNGGYDFSISGHTSMTANLNYWSSPYFCRLVIFYCQSKGQTVTINWGNTTEGSIIAKISNA